jgi:protein DGCR14
MPPPPPLKKLKRPSKVIDEDKYTAALQHIIARDFFPGLAESDTTQEFLHALESRDQGWIDQAGQKLTQMMTPGPEARRARGRRGTSMTPMPGAGSETPRGWMGDTPRTVVGSEVGDDKQDKEEGVDTNMSLSAFTAKYTSEDNEAFARILDRDNAEKRNKNAWLWNGNQIAGGARAIEAAQSQKRIEALTSPSVSNDLILAEEARDKRPAMPEWKKQTDPKNNFMFNPDSLEDWQETSAQAAEARSLVPPKAINHAGTRIMTEETRHTLSVPPSPSMRAVDAAIAGRPRASTTDAGYSGAETPRVRGYAFVDAEVQPHEEVYMERRTKGEQDADAVLKLLGPVDATPNPFTISESSKREQLHLRMVDKVNSRTRRPQVDRVGALAVGDTPGRTPTPKFMSASGIKKVPENLTPAAKSLLKKIGTPMRKPSAFDGKSGSYDVKERSKLAGVTPRLKR